MTEPTTAYIHGTHPTEQERLAQLNALTNPPFLRFLDLKPTDCVLEVGSGLGILAREVAQLVPEGEAIGIEFAPEQLERAQSTPYPSNLHFTRGDAHHLPFDDNAFDVVYCRYVLEHVQDPLAVLREMRRVLKPGGRAYAQENDTALSVFDPDCPHTDALIQKFIVLQAKLGGDGRIGKRLFGLFRHANFRGIELSYAPEIHPASEPTFHLWIENILAIIAGAVEALQAHHLATEDEIRLATAELESLLTRDDATSLFHWNRAVGIK